MWVSSAVRTPYPAQSRASPGWKSASPSPSNGSALTFTGLVPDLDHYNGRGGRVFPLWQDHDAKVPNILHGVLDRLARKYKKPVAPEDMLAYIAAVMAHPAFTERFKAMLR